MKVFERYQHRDLRRLNRSAQVACAIVAFVLPAAAQARDATIYSSFPLQGAAADQTSAMVNAARLALDDAGTQPDLTIRYVSMDNATALTENWTPEATARNARRACADPTAVAYVGEYNSGATAVSLPILNTCGIAQISPTNTAPGLTTSGPGADAGEPATFYPTGRRTYVRITPHDHVQGAALAGAMAERCKTAAIAHDGEVFGAGLAESIVVTARRIGLRTLPRVRINPLAANYRRVADRFRARNANCFVFAGVSQNNAVQLFRDVARRLPKARLFGGDGVAESGFSDPKKGGVPASIGRRVRFAVAPVSASSLPAAGQALLTRFSERHKTPNPNPYLIYGYEAMALAISAVRAGSGDRSATVAALLGTRDRDSVLGKYSIDPNGDTTLRTYGLYRVSAGDIVFERALVAP